MAHVSEGLALAALKVGLDKATELGEPSCVAIVDAGGNLTAFARSDDAAFGVGEIAINKAYTAAALRCRTEDLYRDAQPGGEAYGLEVAGRGRPFVLFGGGAPIRRDGAIIGAVGVSGGPVAADIKIADSMLQHLEERSGSLG